MATAYTPERVLELLKHAESQGINTWQNSYAERTLSDLDRYRAAGGKMHWLCLGKPDWEDKPQSINEAAKRKPIGIAPHGALAERLHRQNKWNVLTDLLKRIRDQGVLVMGSGNIVHNLRLMDRSLVGQGPEWASRFDAMVQHYVRDGDDEALVAYERQPDNELAVPTPDHYLPLLYTIGAAYATGEEHVKGKLAPGYYADFVALGDNPLTVEPARLSQIPVLATYVAGKRIWSRASAIASQN